MLSRKNSKRVRIRAGHRRRGRRGDHVVWRCRGGVPTVASFSPLVRKNAHQTVSQLSPGRASRVTRVTADPPGESTSGLGRGHGRPARHDPNRSAGCRCHTPMIWVAGVPPAWSFGKRARRPFPPGFATPVTPSTHPPTRGSRDSVAASERAECFAPFRLRVEAASPPLNPNRQAAGTPLLLFS